MFSLRRLFLLVVLAGAGYAGFVAWRRDRNDEVAPPEWPPFPPATWVEPEDGACPLDHPVKLNENSGIFHVPGGRFYDRTRADRCYASADAAEADGYRQAKA